MTLTTDRVEVAGPGTGSADGRSALLVPVRSRGAASHAPTVSVAEFQRLARLGAARLAPMRSASATVRLDRRWGSIVKEAYLAVQQPWGGITVHASTGRPVRGTCDGFAVTVKDPGQETVWVPATASRRQFGEAMNAACRVFAANLRRPGAHLGVFHDAGKGRIDIDPVAVVSSRDDAHTIGAATRATGGAYHFKSGLGVFPPRAAG